MDYRPIYHHAISSSQEMLKDGRRLVLSVEADAALLQDRFKVLTSAGYAVVSASDAAQALDLFGCWKPDLVLLPSDLPIVAGDIVAEAIRKHTPDTPIIMICDGTESLGRSQRLVDTILNKTDNSADVLAAVRRFLPSSAKSNDADFTP